MPSKLFVSAINGKRNDKNAYTLPSCTPEIATMPKKSPRGGHFKKQIYKQLSRTWHSSYSVGKCNVQQDKRKEAPQMTLDFRKK